MCPTLDPINVAKAVQYSLARPQSHAYPWSQGMDTAPPSLYGASREEMGTTHTSKKKKLAGKNNRYLLQLGFLLVSQVLHTLNQDQKRKKRPALCGGVLRSMHP